MCSTVYLDDFLIVAGSVRDCNYLMTTLLKICQEIGVPMAHEKTEWGLQTITFLGFLLDGGQFRLSIPEEKRIRAVNLLQILIDRSKCKATVRELQQLAGFLNFLSRAIFPGRAFTRRMYSKFSGTEFMHLKQHHHVKLDLEFIQDCKVWLEFLDQRYLATVSRPFVDFNDKLIATKLEFYSDASLNEHFGVGARFNNQWFFAQWPENFIKDCKASIQYVELLGLTMAVFTWIKYLSHKRVIIFCDNLSVVQIVKQYSTGGKNDMILMWKFVLKCLEHDCRLFPEHIRSESNEIADSLSRMDFKCFIKLARKKNLKPCPEPLPEELWPVTKIWETES